MAPLVSGRTHHADAPRLGTVVPAPSGPQRSGTAAPTVPGSSPVVPRLLLDEQRHVVVTGQHERRLVLAMVPSVLGIPGLVRR